MHRDDDPRPPTPNPSARRHGETVARYFL
jgi:hypothetical protein